MNIIQDKVDTKRLLTSLKTRISKESLRILDYNLRVEDHKSWITTFLPIETSPRIFTLDAI
jgi:hypothetical protein